MSTNESERVKKYKNGKMKEGYKNISFLVSPQEFKLIKRERRNRKMSTRELLMFYITGQDNLETFGYEEISSLPFGTPEEIIQSLKKEEIYGKAFYLPKKKNLILIRFRSVDNTRIKIIKDFDEYQTAIDFYDKSKFKGRIALLKKVSEMLNNDPDIEWLRDWYWIKQEW